MSEMNQGVSEDSPGSSLGAPARSNLAGVFVWVSRSVRIKFPFSASKLTTATPGVGMLLGLAVLVYKPDQQWPGLFVGLQRF